VCACVCQPRKLTEFFAFALMEVLAVNNDNLFYQWYAVPPPASVSLPSPLPEPELMDIRWMIPRDMEAVLQIENESFEFAWREEEFMRCLRQRNCIGMVAESRKQVHGFTIYEIHKRRLHVLNFAVARAARRLGVGSQMVKQLVKKLSTQRRKRITLTVRETNLSAQLFFRSCGFRATSILRHFYDDSLEDAYLMEYPLPTAGAKDACFASAGLNRITRFAE